MPLKVHPRDVLMGAQAGARVLPVCDHYCGLPARMEKSLALQRQMAEEFGACVFDVTLDCEDGAAVGAELAHAHEVLELGRRALAAPVLGSRPVPLRVAVRLHAVDHPAFLTDARILCGPHAPRWSHIMLPKVESRAQLQQALAVIDGAGGPAHQGALPVHVLIESPAAVAQVADIVSHPRVESASFGLMDFVSAHGGAIPASAMGSRLGPVAGVQGEPDQFTHPLVLRAKLEVAAACHAWGKVPSHCVVTEFKDKNQVAAAARWAAGWLGYTRMWSIHPDQIRPILQAFAPLAQEVDDAAEVLLAAQAAQWGPTSVKGQLHDRASYRYHWQVLQRAHQTGCLPEHHPGCAFFE